MISNCLLRKWQRDVAVDSIIVDDDDINNEAQKNMWCFSLTSDQAEALDVEDIVIFLKEIIESRRQQICEKVLPAMVFYAWHDEMANQLRLSMVSSRKGIALPFNGPINTFVKINEIASSFLKMARVGGITWNEVMENSSVMQNGKLFRGEEATHSHTISVFSCELSRGVAAQWILTTE
jgi:hypothetical protein